MMSARATTGSLAASETLPSTQTTVASGFTALIVRSATATFFAFEAASLSTAPTSRFRLDPGQGVEGVAGGDQRRVRPAAQAPEQVRHPIAKTRQIAG